MISIIVPVYNVEKYIVKCLESIVNQDYSDFELLLVNDGSTDDSIVSASNYLKNKNIDYKIIEKENGGLASARNEGIKNAKGDFIAFVDADDVISKDFISSLVKYLDYKDVDFSFCAFRHIKKQELQVDNNSNFRFFTKEELLETFLKRTIDFVVPSMVFKKDFIINNNLYFNENLRFSEDQPFIWNVILHSEKSVYLYKKMYGYFYRESSIMNSTSFDKLMNSHIEYSDYTEKLFSKYPEYKNITDMVLPRWQLGSLFTASKLLDYKDYKKLYDAMDGRTILNRIKGIGENKSYLLAMVSKISPRLLYMLCRKMNLNG